MSRETPLPRPSERRRPCTGTPELPRLTERQAAFLAALAVNGGVASRAAQQVGLHPAYGRELVSQHPVIRDLAKEVRMAPLTEIRKWREIAETARRVIDDILTKRYDATDPRSLAELEGDKLKLKAAIYAVDRVEGKPMVRVEAEIQTHESISQDALRLAVNLTLQVPDVTMAEAIQWVRDHPAEVKAWAAENPLPRLPAGPGPDDAPTESM